MLEIRRASPVYAAVAASLLAAAACAGRAPRPSAAIGALTAAPASLPLTARLGQPFHRTLRFDLSEPAYVTIFEIVPGRGASVVYPAPYDDSGRPLAAGPHTELAVPYNLGRWYYADSPIPSLAPTFLYMIASRAPLRIGDVLHNPALLRRTVGFATFTQYNEQRMMDALDDHFVPDYVADESWTSDWIALWPDAEPELPRLEAQLAAPRCDDTQVLVPVPGPVPAFTCAPRSALKQPPPAAPRDSADTTAKGPRHPAASRTEDGTPPSDVKATPRRGRRAAPKELRRESTSLVVDYGVPRDDGRSRTGHADAWTVGDARDAADRARSAGDDEAARSALREPSGEGAAHGERRRADAADRGRDASAEHPTRPGGERRPASAASEPRGFPRDAAPRTEARREPPPARGGAERASGKRER